MSSFDALRLTAMSSMLFCIMIEICLFGVRSFWSEDQIGWCAGVWHVYGIGRMSEAQVARERSEELCFVIMCVCLSGMAMAHVMELGCMARCAHANMNVCLCVRVRGARVCRE